MRLTLILSLALVFFFFLNTVCQYADVIMHRECDKLLDFPTGHFSIALRICVINANAFQQFSLPFLISVFIFSRFDAVRHSSPLLLSASLSSVPEKSQGSVRAGECPTGLFLAASRK